MEKGQETIILERVMEMSTRQQQAAIAIEEMAELTQVLVKHYHRGVDLTERVIEEIADVELMLHQLKIALSQDESWANGAVDVRLETVKDYKLRRLAERIDRGQLTKDN